MLRNTVACVLAGSLAAVSLSLAPVTAEAGKPAKGTARYLISHPAGNAAALKAAIARAGGTVAFDYSRIDGLAADLTPAALATVRRSGLATSIDEDAMRQLHAHLPDFSVQFNGWGVERIHAPDAWAMGATGHGVVVAVLDTGIDYDHPDLADNILDLRGDGAIRDFIDGDADPTDDAGIGHGSFVASVIASVDNGVGVVGVAPHAKISAYRICEEFCPTSAIIGGILQAIDDGVEVINMSLGGSAGMNLEARAVQAANQAGIVVVASAGNDASQKVQFPAGYDTTLAVGATDENDAPASFTNYGGWVDLTGPGVDIPGATCEGCGLDATVEESSPVARSFASIEVMENSAVGAASGQAVDVGRGCNVDTYAADPSGKIAVIVRGACSFAEKVSRAETAGAIGTIVFNNAPGGFAGTLGTYVAAHPSVSMSAEEGALLTGDIAANGGTANMSMNVFTTDYRLWNGTSFSAPHVAGVAALVKSVAPQLSPIQVRSIIEKTAEPIGHQLIFGRGMVRADRAVQAAQ